MTTLTPILDFARNRRGVIRDKVIDGLNTAFPLKAKAYTVELSNPRVEEQVFSSDEQKQALLAGNTLSERVRGDLTVKDAAGKVLSDAKGFTLMHLPWFTPRHTFIVDGTEYSVSNQIRTKPGVYTRRRGNEELEAMFNLSKGANFRLLMEPAKGLLLLQPTHGTTRIPLYPILRALGVPHQDIASEWSSGVAEMNRDAYKTPDRHVEKAYTSFIHPALQTHVGIEAKAQALREYFEKTVMDPAVNQETLGKPYDKVSSASLLAASKKLLEVHRSAADTDDRDSLAFKTFHSVDDFLRERVVLAARAMRGKLGIKLDASGGNLRKALPAGPFTRSVHSFLANSALSAVPMQINPAEILDEAVRVTALGEGAIPSERAIPMEARNLHSTHMGIMDPYRTPESFKTGIDIRTAIGTMRDENGNLYAPMIDIKTGKETNVSVKELQRSVVAFPGEDVKHSKTVAAMKDGKVTHVPASEVTHQVPNMQVMQGPTTNLLPFLNGMQGNRVLMASKHQSQALSLVDREAPLVQVGTWKDGVSFEKHILNQMVPWSPVSGTVTHVENGYIHIRPDGEKQSAEGDAIKIPYDTNFPLAAGTFLHDTLNVKPGDHVTAGQTLADSNWSKNGVLALGKNLRVAYMPYRGLNTNDGIVISESCGRKLISEHMYKHVLPTSGGVELSRDKHQAYFGTKYGRSQYTALDKDGVIKPGSIVHTGDPLIAGLRENKATGDAVLLGRLSKSLVKPFAEETETWEHDHPGEVIDVVKGPEQVSVTVKVREPMRIGDKLSNRFGGKGVISKIIPDAQMIHDGSDKPLDIIVTSAGVVSRINPGQIIEAALGKVAEKTGKPIIVNNFDPRDNVQFAKDQLKANGLKDKETVFDPITGKYIPNVFVGRAYFLKLFKTTDSNWSSHGVDRYDFNEQPAKGGEEGAKAIGKMEFDGLVAHNARNVLREASSIKSQRNDAFWRAIQLGLPTPSPAPNFAYNKFLGMMQGAGIKVSKTGSRLALGPLTDADITKMSNGALRDPYKLVRAKDLSPESGGLFDPLVTGGSAGTKWSHVQLSESIVNPVFEEPVRRLLGLTQKEFDDKHSQYGGAWFHRELKEMDLDDKKKELTDETKTAKGAALDNAVKQLKYLSALKSINLTPDKAYILNKIPVTPPILRPILPLKDGQLQVGDVNLLYRDAFLAAEKLKEAKEVLPEDELRPARQHLYNAIGAVFGVHEPVSPMAEKRGAKGYLNIITGSRPGNGFFQSKLMKRQQDVSGRATIAPDPTLSLDEVGVPEDMLWGMYNKFVVGRLVKKGYPALDAQKMVEDKSPLAKRELIAETGERPVIINRAPSLHRFSLVGAYPKLTTGKTLLLNPFAEKGMNADYDGDAMQIHAPVTAAGVADVKKMTLSNLIFSDRGGGHLNITPDHEAVIGLHRATIGSTLKKIRSFNSRADALAAYHRGDVELSDSVEID